MTDKEWIEKHIDQAYEIIKDVLLNGDANGKIPKKFRNGFSSFGASVIMGSVSSASVSFWSAGKNDMDQDEIVKSDSNNNDASYKANLVKCVYKLLSGEKLTDQNVIEKFKGFDNRRDDVLNATAALKLACDLFERLPDENVGG